MEPHGFRAKLIWPNDNVLLLYFIGNSKVGTFKLRRFSSDRWYISQTVNLIKVCFFGKL